MRLTEAIDRKSEGHGKGLAPQLSIDGKLLASAGTHVLEPGVFYEYGRKKDLKGCVEEEKKHPEYQNESCIPCIDIRAEKGNAMRLSGGQIVMPSDAWHLVSLSIQSP